MLHDKKQTAEPIPAREAGTPPTFLPITMLVPLDIRIDDDHSTIFYCNPSQMDQWMQSLPTTSIGLFVGLSN